MQDGYAKSQGSAALDWTALQYFHSLALCGQMAKAAGWLGIDPTTVARRIRRLEAQIGTVLFEQTRSGHVLTGAGERLFVQVEAMQRAADFIQDAPDTGEALTGLIRLSVSEGFGTGFVAALLGDFHRAHPQVVVELAATSGFLSPSRRETDVAVMLARPRSGPVVSRKLADYRLRLYAAHDHPAARAGVADPRDLARHVLVGYIPELLYAPELRYLDDFGEDLMPALRSSSINAQHAIIASGAGIGVLPRFMGDADPALAPILPDRQITRSFWIVTHRDTRQLTRVRLFHDWLTATVAARREQLLGRD